MDDQSTATQKTPTQHVHDLIAKAGNATDHNEASGWASAAAIAAQAIERLNTVRAFEIDEGEGQPEPPHDTGDHMADALRYGIGMCMTSTDEDGNATCRRVPLAEFMRDNMEAEGEKAEPQKVKTKRVTLSNGFACTDEELAPAPQGVADMIEAYVTKMRAATGIKRNDEMGNVQPIPSRRQNTRWR